MSTKSKIALVTGGSRGLGRDMVINLARNGNNIIFTYHSNKTEADKVVSEVLSLGQKAIAYPLDLGNIKAFDSYVDQVHEHLLEYNDSPNFDYLINNAGVGLYGSVTDTTEEVFDTLMNVNFKGVFFLTQKLLRWLPKTAHFFAQPNAKWITEKKERLGEAMSLISSRNWLEC